MPQPFDYSIDVPDPTSQVLTGAGAGAGIRDMREQRQLAEVAKQKKAQLDAAIAGLGPKSTLDDYTAVHNMLAVINPEMAKQMLAGFDALSEEKKSNLLRFGSQVLSAVDIDPVKGVELLKERAVAERNSGNEEQAKAWETWAELVELDPDAAFNTMGTMMAGLGEGEALSEVLSGRKTVAEAEAITGQEDRAKDLEALTKRHKEAEVGKLVAETNKVWAEVDEILAGIGKEDQLSSKERMNMEDKLEDVYSKRTASLRKNRQELQNMRHSAADDSGQGDIGLIFGFMKMLDEDSVVRESEYATAASAQGLFNKLSELYNKLTEGKFLKPTERTKFVKLAEKFITQAEEYGEEQYWLNLSKAQKRDLDPTMIFTQSDLETYGTDVSKRKKPKTLNVNREVLSDLKILDDVNSRIGSDITVKSDVDETDYMIYAKPKE